MQVRNSEIFPSQSFVANHCICHHFTKLCLEHHHLLWFLHPFVRCNHLIKAKRPSIIPVQAFFLLKKNGFISVGQLDLEIEFSYFETQFGQYFLVNSKLDTDRATNFWPNSDSRPPHTARRCWPEMRLLEQLSFNFVKLFTWDFTRSFSQLIELPGYPSITAS